MANVTCTKCGKGEVFGRGYTICSDCMTSRLEDMSNANENDRISEEKQFQIARAESEKKQQEWEELLERGQKKMTDPEKLIYAQMQIITELLSEIADGINSSNKIASAPRYGFGVGTFFGGE